MKKVIALLLAMSMTVAAFTGCTAGQKASEEKKTETADKTSDKKEDGDKVYHIGIIQLVEHQALDAATEGFQKALKEKLGDGVVVLASAKDGKVSLLAMATDGAMKKGAHAGNLIKAIASIVGGGGGGRPNMAQAGGKNPAGIKDAMEAGVKEAEAQLS